MLKKIVIMSLMFFLTEALCLGDDWPQFRGPNRDGISHETGLLKRWPEEGPRLLWSAAEDLGTGYSSAAIAGGIVYVTGLIGKEGVLFAFGLDGRLEWKKVYGPEWTGSWPGTRSTPTIDKERIYILSGHGAVYCCNARTGKKIWSRDVAKEYLGINTRWGWAESLLIVDDKVICTPGGKKATMVALLKRTGEVVWDQPDLGEVSAFCSPALIERGGNKIIANRTENTFFGVDARDGTLHWSHDCEAFMKPAKPPHVHTNAPIHHDGHVYITSGYDAGGMMFSLSDDGKAIALKWTDKILDVHLGGVVLVDGQLHGSSYVKNKPGEWISLNWDTGNARYRAVWSGGRGAVIHADGMLYCYGEETGDLGLVKGGPEFEVVSSFRIPKTKSKYWWAHPSIADGRLFVRHDKTLRCYDLRK
jgi:outer membrane protein assembly factor BamB